MSNFVPEKTALGIEFGSTRIKAVLLDEKHAIVKSGDYTWKSSLETGCFFVRGKCG